MCTDSDLEDVENASEPSSASDDESADDEEDDCEDEHRDDPDGRHDAVTGRCEAVAAIERPTARAGHVASAEDEEEQDELDDSSSDVGQLSVLASARAVRKASNARSDPRRVGRRGWKRTRRTWVGSARNQAGAVSGRQCGHHRRAPAAALGDEC